MTEEQKNPKVVRPNFGGRRGDAVEQIGAEASVTSIGRGGDIRAAAQEQAAKEHNARLFSRSRAGIIESLGGISSNAHISVMLGGDTFHLPLQSTMNKPLTEIEDIAAYLTKSGAKSLTLHVPVMQDAMHYTFEKVTLPTEVLGQKPLVDILAESAVSKNPKAVSPLKAAIEGISEGQGFRQRLGNMRAMELGWTAANTALATLFMFEAAKNFHHVRQQNPLTGKTETSWSNLTWGTVNAGLAGLSAMSAYATFKGGGPFR